MPRLADYGGRHSHTQDVLLTQSKIELRRYEEEEEFDAVTDVLAPKEVYLVGTPAGSNSSLMTLVISQLNGISFDAGFTSEQVLYTSR